MTWTFLASDWLFFGLLVLLGTLIHQQLQSPQQRQRWQRMFQNPVACITGILMLAFLAITLLDSLHFKHPPKPYQRASQPMVSALDMALYPMGYRHETSFSRPFSTHTFSSQTAETTQGFARTYPSLHHVHGLPHTHQGTIYLTLIGKTLLWTVLCLAVLTTIRAIGKWQSMPYMFSDYVKHQHGQAHWPAIAVTLLILCAVGVVVHTLSPYYYIMGTDKIGHEVLYQGIKSIRTGLLIGTLTTFCMLPFALVMGICSGYFGGKTDHIIQYIYTTLSAIPGVLLIAAAVLTLDIWLGQQPMWFATLTERADARLLALCAILGLTGWTPLCRLLRGETLKLREMDFVANAKVLGTQPMRILSQHILPNVMHLVLITVVMDFSGLVLAEAVLSYIGVGVDPTTISWGNMINAARLELSRDPVVWWPLACAFAFMFVLVLAANLFADQVRDALNPHHHQR